MHKRDLSRGRSPNHRSPRPDKKRLEKYAEYHHGEASRSRAPEHYNSDGTRGRHDVKSRRPEHCTSEGRNKYPEEYLYERNRNVEAEYTEHQKGKKYQTQDQGTEPPFDQEPKKERLYMDNPVDRDTAWDKERDRARRRGNDREKERDGRKNRDKVQSRDGDRSQDKLLDLDTVGNQLWHPEMGYDLDRSDNRHRSKEHDLDREKDRRGAKEKERGRDKHRRRDRSRGREFDNPSLPSPRSRSHESLEDLEYGSRLRANSGLNEVFEEPSSRGHSGEPRSPRHHSRERGMKKGPCV